MFSLKTYSEFKQFFKQSDHFKEITISTGCQFSWKHEVNSYYLQNQLKIFKNLENIMTHFLCNHEGGTENP